METTSVPNVGEHSMKSRGNKGLLPVVDRLAAVSGRLEAQHREAFQSAGFIIIERLVPGDAVERLRDRFEPLFRGDFETGVYPDEWYWREGMSLPSATRHMGNAWKSDLTIRSLAHSPTLARLAATLAGWDGARIGTDTLWWKPPGASEIAFHQDDTYGSFLDPPESITCWVTLDRTSAEAGTIEYVAGSNRWPLKTLIGDFHTPGDYRAAMLAAADAAGERSPEIVRLELPAGSCVIHSGRVWHGSDRNRTTDITRRSIGIHLLRDDARFAVDDPGYTYGRYKRAGDRTMDENFFPILWRRDGYRSPQLGLETIDPLLTTDPTGKKGKRPA